MDWGLIVNSKRCPVCGRFTPHGWDYCSGCIDDSFGRGEFRALPLKADAVRACSANGDPLGSSSVNRCSSFPPRVLGSINFIRFLQTPLNFPKKVSLTCQSLVGPSIGQPMLNFKGVSCV